MGRKKQPENTIAQILDAAQKLFLEKGYEQTTMQDIVEHTDGLSRGAIYHHFKSKDEIINAISDRLYLQEYGYDSEKDSGLNALERIRNRWIHAYNYHVESDILLMSASLLQNPKYLAVHLQECIKNVVPQIKQLIEDGNRDGSMNVQSVEATAELLSFLVNSWCIPAIYPGTAEQAIERFKLLGKQGEALGVPFMNQELLNAYKRYAEKFTD